MSKKRNLFGLIEHYINEYHKNSVEEFYGEGSRIKIHNINYSITEKSILMEAVVILGNNINESVLDRSMADALIQEAMVYFYPECSIKSYVRYDV
jgi:hypothetical protein